MAIGHLRPSVCSPAVAGYDWSQGRADIAHHRVRSTGIPKGDIRRIEMRAAGVRRLSVGFSARRTGAIDPNWPVDPPVSRHSTTRLRASNAMNWRSPPYRTTQARRGNPARTSPASMLTVSSLGPIAASGGCCSWSNTRRRFSSQSQVLSIQARRPGAICNASSLVARLGAHFSSLGASPVPFSSALRYVNIRREPTHNIIAGAMPARLRDRRATK